MLIVVGVIFCLVIIHPIITILLIGMMAFIFAVYEYFVKEIVIKMGKLKTISSIEITKAVIEALQGLKEIRVLGKEKYFIDKVEAAAETNAKSLAVYNALQLIPRYAVESLAAIFLVGLILSAMLIGKDPLSIVPTLGVFSAACIRLLPIIGQVISQFSQFRSSKYVTELLYSEIQQLENQHKLRSLNHYTDIKSHFETCNLIDVSFSYENTKHITLSDINMTLTRGTSIGLIGASGAGKSTLVSIILGLLKPNNGQLLVDGKPIENLRQWLNNFAYIPQSIYLLDDTLKRNVALGIEDQHIDMEKMNTAIKMAQLTDVVSDLPQGVDTLIGENGVRLSGGQRQRVALARALYHEREIIVMDEATSALDNETEREVINSIKRLHGVKTLIVIAHRVSTIEYCDFVYRLDRGKIVDQGTYDKVVSQYLAQVH